MATDAPAPARDAAPPRLGLHASRHFAAWLAAQGASLAVTRPLAPAADIQFDAVGPQPLEAEAFVEKRSIH